MFNLVGVVDVFLPQLLLYPNAASPLNGAAASLLLRDVAAFQAHVREHTRMHADPARVHLPPSDAAPPDDNGDALDTASSSSQMAASADETQRELSGTSVVAPPPPIDAYTHLSPRAIASAAGSARKRTLSAALTDSEAPAVAAHDDDDNDDAEVPPAGDEADAFSL